MKELFCESFVFGFSIKQFIMGRPISEAAKADKAAAARTASVQQVKDKKATADRAKLARLAAPGTGGGPVASTSRLKYRRICFYILRRDAIVRVRTSQE